MKEKDSMTINELYNWVNERYESYTNNDITEEQYMEDLQFYKEKLAKTDELVAEYTTEEEVMEAEKINPRNVRSASIASLRAKLLEEMKE